MRGGQPVERDLVGDDGGDRLDVGRVAAGRADEGVLADRGRVEELLAPGAAHRPRHRRDDHVLQAEPVEDPDVGVAVQGVARVQPGVVDVEGVAVLHRELAAAEQAGAGPRLVPVLGLDLVQRDRQVLVGAVEVLHQEREHLLVGGAEQEVVPAAVLEAEEVGAVLGPAAGGLVGLARQQGREGDLLRAHRVHLLADDALDVAEDPVAQRQPGEPARRGPADVPAAGQEAVAGDLGVGRVVAQGPQEQGRHPKEHGRSLPGGATPYPRPGSRSGAHGRPSHLPSDELGDDLVDDVAVVLVQHVVQVAGEGPQHRLRQPLARARRSPRPAPPGRPRRAPPAPAPTAGPRRARRRPPARCGRSPRRSAGAPGRGAPAGRAAGRPGNRDAS